MYWLKTLPVLSVLALPILFACGGGSGGDGGPRTGRISVAVTDAPVDEAAGVFLTVQSVTLQGVGGSVDQAPVPVPQAGRLINLMEYTGTDSAPLITGIEVPAGTYKLRLDADLTFTAQDQRSWIAFAADSAQCQTLAEGAVWSPDNQTCRYPLQIPSGEQSGFKPDGTVTVMAGGATAFTAEFDLRKNLVDPQATSGIAYVLKPTGLRLVDDALAGSIAGTVAPALFGATCPAERAKVYLFDRAGQTTAFNPDDIHPANTSLVTSAAVSLDPGAAQPTYRYRIGFVPAGTYAVALVCAPDDPELDENLTFAAQADGVTVGARSETVQDLHAAP